MTTEKSFSGWYFLGITIIAFIVTAIINSQNALEAANVFLDIIVKVVPTILIIIVLMTLINYFVKPKQLVKYLGKKSGVKGWFIAIIGGILSSGPIYMWYPLLNELQKKGVKNSLIATFLYNRSVKIALIPLLLMYFGATYTITLLIVMIIISIAQGWTTEKLMEIHI